MLEFDSKKKILYAYKNPIARPSLDNPIITRKPGEHNIAYESFRRYIDEQCRDDVMNVFMPLFQNAINPNSADCIQTFPNQIEIKNVDPGFFNDRTQHVMPHFKVPGWEDLGQRTTIMKLPTVSEDGTIEYESRQYAFIHMLEQEPAVSFERNDNNQKPATIKIKNSERSIWIDNDAKKLKVRFSDIAGRSSKTKFTLIDIIMAMADYEGYDKEKLWAEFANFSITNMFSDADDKDSHIYYYGGNQASVNAEDYPNKVVPRLTLTRIKLNGAGDNSYDNTLIRDNLNNLLSIDRAVGEVLAKDVYSEINPSNEPIFKAGRTLSEQDIEALKSEGVYKLYVKYIPNVEGYYLAENIFVHGVHKGLKMNDTVRPYFPNEHGMYLSKDYVDMPNPIMFGAGERITRDIIDVILAFGLTSINVVDKPGSKDFKTLNFYEEIISNRQFRGTDVGMSDDQWYYLDATGSFIPNNGAYTTYDFVALQSMAIKLFEGKWIDLVVNSDIGFRKRLVPLQEQYHRAFCYACREAMTQMSRSLREIYQKNPGDYLIADRVENKFYPFEKAFWRYLRDEAKCIVALQSDSIHNPIAYQSACTKVNVYTANKHSVAASQREIAIGSYGKIDPYEIPQSGKMGTVYNSTCGASVDLNGVMRTMYYKVVRYAENLYRLVTENPVWLTAEEEERYTIADIASLELGDKNVILNPNDNVLCRVHAKGSMENQTFANRYVHEVQYVNAYANQPLSWSSSTIPFMGSNDAARAIFAVAQEKAVKGLVEPEEPDTMTSAYEQYPWLNDKFGYVAKADGEIDDVFYDWRKERYSIFIHYEGYAVNDGEIYEFDEYFDSGYSVTKLQVHVKAGDKIKKGDVLVSSNFISKNGILQFGRNALVAYQCDGFNYEDGSHISDSFCRKLASYRINKEDFSGNPKNTSKFNLDSGRIGEYVGDGSGATIRCQYKRGTNSFGTIKKTQKITKAYGFIEGFDPIINESNKAWYGNTLKCVSVDEFSKGDKASNRHGNKGVLAKREPDCNMPRLMNGMAIDVVLNPLGVGSRMNVGQVKEMHTGLFSHVLGIKTSADAYNGITDDEIHIMMSLTVDLMNSTGNPDSILVQYREMVPDNLLDWCRTNISNIRRYAGCFNKKGTTKLILPTNDNKFTETEVSIGYVYMFKLIQESHKKIHARGNMMMGEHYGRIDNAPPEGSSNQGGQRFGTMEIDALCAYGVPKYIEELTNARGDNGIARNNLMVNTYLPPRLRDKYLIEGKGQRRSVTQFLYTMLSLGIMSEPEDGEFLPLDRDNGVNLSYWKYDALRRAGRGSTDQEDSDNPRTESNLGVPDTGIEAFDKAIQEITPTSEEDLAMALISGETNF